ncbi:pilus assembly protein [Pseudomonas chlororaphis]|uniref:Pilus assembly protein n=1 Tax=Pseudomonas chlororaphis TaxID=587753 RepID=A0A1Q8EJR9_9PSED|nr:PilC/PilY family type IV pilus protein [Pseudomonas chlororaphis]OLF52051.1 pilus assembly protein [Pseudomonas chlororaphis]
MPSIERRARRLERLAVGAALGFCLGATAYGFTPAQAPLANAAAVAPNVMLLLDDSQHMSSIVYAAGFDPGQERGPVRPCRMQAGQCLAGASLDAQSVALATLEQAGCAAGKVGFYRDGARPLCLKLPDPAGSGRTRYPAAYLAYLIALADGRDRDFTDGSIPDQDRMTQVRDAASRLVADNRALRIGLASFNPPAGSDMAPGGRIVRVISDLAPVGQHVSQAQADDNYRALQAAIGTLRATAEAPLAETYYEISRYFRGMAPYYNTAPSTYGSPIQYRCQRNYGLVVSAGLPSYDHSFPLRDPQSASRLPDWDGVANDGSNPGGNEAGSSLYLDDIAKLAADIDMRTTGADIAGKSWDSAGFAQQHLNTYTVGLDARYPMLVDAANYGQGKFYPAADTPSLEAALAAALDEVAASAAQAGNATAGAAGLASGSSYFQASYDPADWHGTVRAYGIDPAGVVDTAAPLWSTDSTLVPNAPSGVFQTWNSATRTPVALRLEQLSTMQQAEVAQHLPPGIGAADLLAWSQGVNRSGLRLRSRLLGDIVNAPLAMAAPAARDAADLQGDSGYSTYLATKSQGMRPSLLVNANDGLLSVIDPANGTRRYAYMPSSALPLLHALADPGYANGARHRFLADGPVAVFDTQLGAAWATLALAGTGAGGKAFYAVQLHGQAGNTPQALWEISAPAVADLAHPFNDLGYAYARPEVARLADGRWAAFIGNGYGSHSGIAALYVVDIRDGSLIRKIVVDGNGQNNGLSSVKLRVDSQNVAQAAYGGDLQGRLWKFDLSDATPERWGLAFAGAPLFSAHGGATQPITAQPLLADHPDGGKLVLFGTGKLSELADKRSQDAQGFYGVWDAPGGAGRLVEADLQAQAITGRFAGSAGSYITSTQAEVGYPLQKGWYLPLGDGPASSGERVLNPATLVAGRIVFSTAAVEADDPCSTTGSGKLVELDAFSGKMQADAVLDTNGDGRVDSLDTPSSGVIFTGGIPALSAVLNRATRKIVSDSGGGIAALVEKPGGGSRRIMWRQIQ